MEGYKRLLEYNAAWVERRLAERPDYFTRHLGQQRPEYMWIGCSDSRVPAETITGCEPGDLFVHRNVANVVVHTDFNMLSALHFAIELGVRHVIVCGHVGCGGVKAAMGRRSHGLVLDRWLRKVKDVYHQHAPSLEAIPDEDLRLQRLVELNVVHQVQELARTSAVQESWAREGRPWLHGWVYDIHTGKLREVSLMRHTDLPDDIYRFERDTD